MREEQPKGAANRCALCGHKEWIQGRRYTYAETVMRALRQDQMLGAVCSDCDGQYVFHVAKHRALKSAGRLIAAHGLML